MAILRFVRGLLNGVAILYFFILIGLDFRGSQKSSKNHQEF